MVSRVPLRQADNYDDRIIPQTQIKNPEQH